MRGSYSEKNDSLPNRNCSRKVASVIIKGCPETGHCTVRPLMGFS